MTSQLSSIGHRSPVAVRSTFGRFKFRLTHKIMSIAVIGLMGLIGAGIMYEYGNSAQDAARKLEDAAQGVTEMVSHMSTEMLHARQSEKNFQLHREVSFSKRFADTSAGIERDFGPLKASLKEHGFNEIL